MSDKKPRTKKQICKEKIIIENLLENGNFRPLCYGNAAIISADTCPLQGRTAPNAKRFGIVSYTYRLPIGMRTIQKKQGLPQKDKVFFGEEEPQRRLPSTAKAVDEKQSLRRRSELYLFEKGVKNYFYGGDELRRI